MSKKRMFSLSVLDTDAFMEMSLSAQALYFQLNLRADDDGFVGSPKRVARYVGASAKDLNELIDNRFVIVFDDGAAVIKHWRMHNTIKKDRYTPTNFTDDLAMLRIKENGAYTLCRKEAAKAVPDVSEAEPECITDGDDAETEEFQNGSECEPDADADGELWRTEWNTDGDALDSDGNTNGDNCDPDEIRDDSSCAPSVLQLGSKCAPSVLQLGSKCAPSVLQLGSKCAPSVLQLGSTGIGKGLDKGKGLGKGLGKDLGLGLEKEICSSSDDDECQSLQTDPDERARVREDTKALEHVDGEEVQKIPAEFAEIVEAWNTLAEYGIARIRTLGDSGQRARLLRARIRENGKGEILTAIDNIRKSPFLQGQNDRGWVITFDWFVKQGSFAKVLEGNYNARSGTYRGKKKSRADEMDAWIIGMEEWDGNDSF